MLTTIWHFIQHFTLGDIPWWFYVAASFAAATAIIIYVPGRLGLCLALLAALALGDIGFEAKGYQEGYAEATARINAEWAARAKKEQDRLAEQFKLLLSTETARADAAEQDNKNLQGRVNDAEHSVPLDANGNPVVTVPAGIASRLYDIAGGRQGSRPDHPPRRAFGPFPLPRMLRLHR